MSIKDSLYSDKACDSVIGKGDFGEHGKSLELADQALVFMVKGLIKKWEMIWGYFCLLRRDYNLKNQRTISSIYQ